MIEIPIPEFGPLNLSHLILDYNGTLACDGMLLAGVAERLQRLARHLNLHVVTADTFGQAQTQLAGLPCTLHILAKERQAEGKLDYLQHLGTASTACIGNGRNDRLMLEAAALGIAVLQQEGAAAFTLTAADVVVGNIDDALDLLLHPLRLCATLRG